MSRDALDLQCNPILAVPAAVVLRKIATIIDADAHPLPYPYRNIKQKAVVHQDDYKLEVTIKIVYTLEHMRG